MKKFYLFSKKYDYLGLMPKMLLLSFLFVLGYSSVYAQTPATIPYNENFSTTTDWQFVNGTNTNQWVLGAAAGNTGNSIYVSNDGGISNDYTGTTVSIGFAFREITFPTSTNNFNVSFDWKSNGEGTGTSDWDNLKVWLVPTTTVLTPGTQISAHTGAVQLGGMHKLNTAWERASYTVPASALSGQTKKLVFQWKNDASTANQTPASVDNISISVITCPAVSANTTTAITTTTAILNWTIGGNETQWEIEYGLAGFVQGSGTSITTSNRPYTLTTLSSSSSYDYYVRAVCGAGDNSFWSAKQTFITPQIPLAVPFTETFASGLNGFQTTTGTQENKWFVGSATGNPANSLYVSNDNGATNTYTPTTSSTTHAYRDITFPTGTQNFSVEFDWKAGGQTATTDYLRVFLVPTTVNPVAGTALTANATNVLIGTYTAQTTPTDWNHVYFLASNATYAGLTYRLVFQWVNNATTGTQGPAAVDNISIKAITCPAISAITTTAITANGAQLNWTAGGTETQWEIEYGPTGFVQGSGTSITTATNPYILSTLTSGTSYDYYVRAICGAGDNSTWSAKQTFTTKQIPLVVPFTEAFANGLNGFQTTTGTQLNKWFVGSATGNPANSLYVSNDNGTTNTYTDNTNSTTHAYRDITFPTGTQNFSLEFDWKAGGEGTTTDFLRVLMIPTSVTPVAGTQLSTTAPNVNINNYNSVAAATVWNHAYSILPNATYAGQTFRIVFEWRNDGSVGTQGPAAIDNFEIKVITCPAVTAITTTTITTTSAQLNWTVGGTETQWEIEYGPTGFVQGSGTSITTATNPYILSTLTSSSSYDYYVRAICGAGDNSTWSAKQTFVTKQIPLGVPFTEAFANGLNGFQTTTGTQVNKWFVGSATGNPANSLYVSNDNGTTNTYTDNTASITHAYRDITFPAGTQNFSLEFDWRAGGEGTTTDFLRVLMIPTSVTPVAGTQLSTTAPNVNISNYNSVSAPTVWNHVYSILPNATYAGQTFRIVFEWRNDGSVGTQGPAAIDNFEIKVITCPVVSANTTTTITATSAQLNWTAGGTETQWEIEYGPTGFVQGSGTSITTTTNPYILSTLTSSSSYDYYVRAICGTGDNSLWSAKQTFLTQQIPATVPFVEPFANGLNGFQTTSGTQLNKWYVGAATGNPANALYISNDNGVTNTYTNTTSVTHAYRDVTFPTSANNFNLGFDWKARGEGTNAQDYDNLRVWMIPTTATPVAGTSISTTVPAGAIQLGFYNLNTGWQHVDINLLSATYSGQTRRLVFQWKNNGSTVNQEPVAIDNFSITEVTCTPVTAVAAANITSTTADISWTNGGTATEWEISYVKAADVNATFTTVLATTNPFTLTNLSHGTTYNYSVRSKCGGDSSIWSPVLSFTTVEIPAVLPFVEPFNNGMNGFITTMGTQVNKWFAGPATGNTGNSMYISNTSGSTNTYNYTTTSTTHAIRTIVFNTTTNNFNLAFDWKAVGQGTTTDYLRVWMVPATATITAGTAITTTNVVGAVNLGSFSLSTVWKTENIQLLNAAYTGTNKKIVFEWINNATTEGQPAAAIDNIQITEITCVAVSDVAISNITQNTADVSWTNGGTETNWDIEYGPIGFILGTGIRSSVTSNPTTISGLVVGSEYSVFVRAKCSPTDSSLWSARKNFRTAQVPVTIPYTEDFTSGTDGFQTTTGTQTNLWYVGAATGNPANSLYVSNDNGVANEYTRTTTSVTHAFRDIQFPTLLNSVNLKFDWKAGGESTFDYLRVWILPLNATFAAGTNISTTTVPGADSIGTFNLSGGTWMSVNKLLPYTLLTNQTKRLVFEWANDPSTGTQGPAAVDNIEVFELLCSTPTNLTINNINENSGLATFNQAATETDWDLEYGLTGFVIGTGTRVAITDTFYLMPGLTASTMYDVYVRSRCGADSSVWTAVKKFKTTQVPASFPYDETFTNAGDGFEFTAGTQVNKWYVGTATGNPANAMYISNDNGTSNAYSFTTASITHAIRDIQFPVLTNNVNFKFDWKGAGQGTTDALKVWVVSSSSILTEGVAITTTNTPGALLIGTYSGNGTTWQTVNQSLYYATLSNQTKRFVFEWYNNASVGAQAPAAVDNISLAIIGCAIPTTVTTTQITGTSALASWKAGATETDWEIEYGTTGFAIGTGIRTQVTDTFLVMSPLLPLTTYDYYVRSRCGADSSAWTAIKTFTTNQIPVTVPYNEPFTNAGDGWQFTNGTQTNKWYVGAATGNPANSMYVSQDNGVANTYSFTSSSTVHAFRDVQFPVTALNNFNLSFDWKAGGEGTTADMLRVWLVDLTTVITPGTVLTASANVELLGTYNLSNGWQHADIMMNNVSTSGQTKRLVFTWKNDGSLGVQGPAAVDNIKISEITCAAVTAVTVSNITATSAVIDWTSTGTSWQVEYGTTGFAIGTGTRTVVNAHPMTLPLASSSMYDVYVRSICGPGDTSLWTPKTTFNTLQVLATLPFIEPFNVPNNGWQYSNGTQVNKWYTGAATGNPANSMYVSQDNGVTNTYDIASTSIVHAYRDIQFSTVPTNNFELSFDWKAGGEGTTADMLRVWMVDANTPVVAGTVLTTSTTNILLGTYSLSNGWQHVNTVLANADYSGQAKRLVFTWKNDGSVGTQGPAAIDNVIVKELTCLAVSAIAVSNITQTTAQVAWTNGGTETEWEVEYGITGFTLGTGTRTLVTTNPTTLSNLVSSTNYDVYVRAKCSATDSSSWRSTSFSTVQVPVTLPYTETFTSATNGWQFNNGTQVNRWYVGSAAGNPANSMYISNDNGVTNTYSTGTAVAVHAYRDVTFPTTTNDIHLSFDWKANGEGATNFYDKIKVWIVPVNATLTAGTAISTTNTPTAIAIGTALNLQTTWQHYSQFLAPTQLSGQTMRLVFEWSNDGSGGTQAPAAIDNIKISVLDCAIPTSLTATSITSNSAKLTWSNTGVTSYTVEYGIAGFAQGTGTIITVNDTTTIINGLDSETQYTFYVTSGCVNTVTSVGGNFTTLCVAPDFTAHDASICTPSAASIAVTSTVANYEVKWYDSETSSTVLTTGSTFTTPVISAPLTTYYATVQEILGVTVHDTLMQLTPQRNYMPTSAGWGHHFTVSENASIDTVTVYPLGTGTIKIVVTNTSNVVLFEGPVVNITGTGYTGPGVKVPVNISLTPGAYKLDAVKTGITDMGSQNIATIGYPFSTSYFSITGGAQGGAAANNVSYMFYNWQVSSVPAGCLSHRIPVEVVLEDLTNAGADNAKVTCRNEPVDLNLLLSNDALTTGTWLSPTNTVIANGAYTTPNIPGQYNIKYVVSNAPCANDTANFIINVQGCDFLSTEKVDPLADVNLYPNPTKGIVYISTASVGTFNYSIVDLSGKVVAQVIDGIQGTTSKIDLSKFEAGVYMIKVYNDDAQKSFRVILQD